MANRPASFEDWYVTSSYQDFVRREGAPLYEGSALADLASLPLADWERRGGKVAYTRLGDQEDYSLQIVEIPPGRRAAARAAHVRCRDVRHARQGRHHHLAGGRAQAHRRVGRGRRC